MDYWVIAEIILYLTLLFLPPKTAGWVGAAAFSVSALPQAWLSFMQGHSEGISPILLRLWCIGEVMMLKYVWPQKEDGIRKWPLLVNYAMNLIFISVIVYYKFFPRV